MRRAMRRTTVERLYFEKSWPVRTRRCARMRRNWSSSIFGPAASLLYRLSRMRSTSRAAIPCTGKMTSATPVAMALRGIDGYSASAGSCTRMMPPLSFTTHADHAVRTGAAENDGKAVAELLGDGAEKLVDRQPPPVRLVKAQRHDLMIGHFQPAVGRDHIDVVGLDASPVSDLRNRHPGVGRQYVRHFAAVLGIEMHNHHKSRAGV